MNSTPTLGLLSVVTRKVSGLERTRITEVAPETSDEGLAVDSTSTLPVR